MHFYDSRCGIWPLIWRLLQVFNRVAINYPSFTPFILETMLQTSAAQCTHEQWRREERASGGSKGLEGLSLSGLGSIIIVAFVVVVIL